MGTVTETTARANNTSNHHVTSNSEKASEALGSLPQTKTSSNTRAKTPRFMSPTVSSRHQATPTMSKESGRKSTPGSVISAKQKGNSWMSSAVRRVGIRRVDERHPHSKEGAFEIENQPQNPPGTRVPDMSSPPKGSLNGTSPSTINKMLPNEKPLPTLPVAQMITTSAIKDTRCLMDASEKPLRRSPPGKPHQEEDWPVLFPEKPTTPDTLTKMIHQDGDSPIVLSKPYVKERYPSLSHFESNSNSIGPHSVPKTNSMQLIQRKPVSGEDKSRTSSSTQQKSKNDQTKPINFQVLPEQSMSAASLEKIENELRDSSQLCQARSSSLRARITAGSVVTTGVTLDAKIVGSPELNPMKEKIEGEKHRSLHNDSQRAISRDRHQSLSSSVTSVFTNKQSTETVYATRLSNLSRKQSTGSIRPRRAPAKIVAGSRRPAMTHRPSSRSSRRSSSCGSDPALNKAASNRSESVVPAKREGINKCISSSAKQKLLEIPEQRRSSIPIFRRVVSDVVDQAEVGADVKDLTPRKALRESTVSLRNELGLCEDPVNAHSAATSKHGNLPAPTLTHSSSEVIDHRRKKNLDEYSMPQTINESPDGAYQIKRLSITFPEHGPTLRISHSADRLIMGTEANKENIPPLKKRNDHHVALLKKDQKKDTEDKKSNTAPSNVSCIRPNSSIGLPQSASRMKNLNIESRQRKAKSADAALLIFHEHPYYGSPPEKSITSQKENKQPFIDDPFLDNQHLHFQNGNIQIGNTLATVDDQKPNSFGGADFADATASKSSTRRVSNTNFVSPAYQPVSVHECVSNSGATAKNHGLAQEQVTEANGFSPDIKKSSDTLSILEQPTKKLSKGPSDPSHSEHPTRSSSHLRVPDYTTRAPSPLRTSPDSGLESSKRKSPGLTTRQDKLNDALGYKSDHEDLKKRSSKRDSIARESSKSHGSQPKGVLSNFRGFFRKGSSDAELKATKKGKGVSITSNGSPFPSASEVHPSTPSTLASKARSPAPDGKICSPSALVPELSIAEPLVTPTLNSPLPSQISTTTTLAMQILDSARKERDHSKQERLLELGKTMVGALTQARDAERAMEEAKLAARKAEVAYVQCEKSVENVTKCVMDWRREILRGRG